ncbi:MAG: hypothetical protein RMJ36_00165 [Candidatus Calescibacterium sp.]|nr:hypothetical protein [Candidatus Calescibacterium sp.]MDW8132059.1 hypothetical protein [Candidatus Calescibacterium sp.]
MKDFEFFWWESFLILALVFVLLSLMAFIMGVSLFIIGYFYNYKVKSNERVE